jgi:hypothetical protein
MYRQRHRVRTRSDGFHRLVCRAEQGKMKFCYCMFMYIKERISCRGLCWVRLWHWSSRLWVWAIDPSDPS